MTLKHRQFPETGAPSTAAGSIRDTWYLERRQSRDSLLSPSSLLSAPQPAPLPQRTLLSQEKCILGAHETRGSELTGHPSEWHQAA